MKKLIFAAIAIVSFAGCVKNEVHETALNNEIGFQAVVGKNLTKAQSTGPIASDAYNDEDTFGAFATLNDGTNRLYLGGDHGVTISKDTDDSWREVGNTYYWPKKGSMIFYAYHPSSVSASVTLPLTGTPGLTITNYTIADDHTVDLMVAKPYKVSDVTASGVTTTPVPAVFQHVLTWISSVKFQAEKLLASGDKFTVKSVKFLNLKNVGTYTLDLEATEGKGGSWGTPTGNVEYVWFTGAKDITAITPTPLNTEAVDGGTGLYQFAIPQTITTATDHIEIIYTVTLNGVESSDITITLKPAADITWGINTKVTYTITLGLDEILWTPDVETWVDGANNSFEI